MTRVVTVRLSGTSERIDHILTAAYCEDVVDEIIDDSDEGVWIQTGAFALTRILGDKNG